MVTEIIIMVIAVILALGMIGEKDKENKKLYCYGFIASVIAVAILKGGIV